jgi:hypothetical protein
MQTDPSACHSPIGSFQRCCCCVVTAPTATGQVLTTTEHRRWRHDSRHPVPMTPLARGQRPGHLRMLMLTHLAMLAGSDRQPPLPGVPHDRSPDRVRVVSSASLRLTANLTAKLGDTRGQQGMAMDAYTRPELRRCGRR